MPPRRDGRSGDAAIRRCGATHRRVLLAQLRRELAAVRRRRVERLLELPLRNVKGGGRGLAGGRLGGQRAQRGPLRRERARLVLPRRERGAQLGGGAVKRRARGAGGRGRAADGCVRALSGERCPRELLGEGVALGCGLPARHGGDGNDGGDDEQGGRATGEERGATRRKREGGGEG